MLRTRAQKSTTVYKRDYGSTLPTPIYHEPAKLFFHTLRGTSGSEHVQHRQHAGPSTSTCTPSSANARVQRRTSSSSPTSRWTTSSTATGCTQGPSRSLHTSSTFLCHWFLASSGSN